MDRKFKWAVLTMMCLLMILALGKLSAEETKERLVLLPVGGENLSDADRSLFQTAIKEGLSKKYEIFSGEQVQAKLEKYSITSCTSDECLERIAFDFNGSLVGRGSVEKDGSGYFITIEIKDVYTDKDVFNKTDGCNACTKTEIMQKLKALTGGGTVSASAPGAVEFASSAAPDKGPAEGAVSRITPKVSGDSGSTVAALFLDSEPSGAAVYLGDIVAGETPYQNMGLKAGQTLRVVLKKDDYHPKTIELKLSGGTNEIDTVKLKPRFGSLSVTSEPAGADVFLAEKKVGATPYKNAKVLSGTYLLSVRKDLYAPVENQTIQILDEKATVKNLSLQADFGTLDVASTPAGARAEVSRKSGKTVHEGETPFSVRLSPGAYEVLLEKEGYDSVSYAVTVNRNGKQSIDAASAVLRRLEGTVIVSSEPYEKGAEVRVDGELKGHVPATLTVSAGEHEIAVKGKKLQGKQKIMVKDRTTETAQVKVTLGLSLGNLSVKGEKERLVLLRTNGENLSLKDAELFQVAIEEGFSSQYIIYSGEQVQAKLQKLAINSATSDECLTRIAIAFNGHLVGRCFVNKAGKETFLRILIKDVVLGKDVYRKDDVCTGCTNTEIIKMLKAMTSVGS